MKPTEILLLSGFLGSGKTTLLQRFLEKEKQTGRKVAVIMNEIGQYSVDSHAVGEDTPLKELLNGCICCSMKDELELTLLSLFTQEQPDVIYIEATGAAHPVDIMDACLHPLIAPYVNMRAVVSLVDTEKWLIKSRLSPQISTLLTEQIRHADDIVLNKMDRVSELEMATAVAEIKEINAHAAIHQVSFAAVDPDAIGQRTGQKDEHIPVTTASLKIQSYTYGFTNAIPQERFEEWLRQLPDTIHRIKGFVQFEQGKTTQIQYSYGIPIYTDEIMKLPMNLVVIGESLDKERLKEELRALENKSRAENRSG
ncbi:GTP-binding protein [Jeotgalibacillus sp. R-1-5s-1]|uniref:CobW family GTP-binding protein n=1 Tax=Jeotgalibacillus sp. R-1-5s-1 TaxID=2555897 RepID=UPI00106A4C35|nr:GTP-binding protein [Jeotgalibacillus sp. R-1-5s-1]TFD96612.1 GTP-binding protein [Jeotgalibacillus sp. R-1-5s-1]